MKFLYERLAWAMNAAGFDTKKDQSRLARLIPCSPQVIQHLLDEEKNAKSSKYLPRIASVLGCDVIWLSDGTGKAPSMGGLPLQEVEDAPKLKKGQLVPVVGEVMGGKEGVLEEYAYPVGHGDGYVEYPSSDPHVYALRVRGDSMHPRYRAGEFVVIEPSIEPQDGDDVVVICVDGRKLLKQLNWLRSDELQLLSINNGYEPLTLKRSEVASLQLVAGRARRSALTR